MTVVVRLQRELAWGDCDPAGIVFYPTYYRWMDAATWGLAAQAGYPAARMRAEHYTLPLVHAACDFLRSPTFGDLVEIRSQVTRWGRSSFSIGHEFVLAGDGTLLARGSESRVWCRYADGPGSALRSAPVPDEVRAALGGPPA
ncbi:MULTISPECIES: acyl-CoA thioesterase [Ramlibacter]|uniref:Acyl-CoA thioesterase n=1 Tax=Ramlibacter pinisoli TaxID=2682844 RepID=A0A6N8IRW6_9BURK|nr:MULTISPECIES: acyl-CoA thioesterase [Ramlibacter]MBA2964619.1 acyl-CoA thioesterase [Ramlibacter sp. CGMCC 1.13660]MVQ29584.1 acyl-CoA thioesterase [Ramlibacter pinisoli]